MEAVLGLALLACPIGMGLMMWFMAKGRGGDGREQEGGEISLAELQAQHARLAAQIDRLEGRDSRPEPLADPQR